MTELGIPDREFRGSCVIDNMDDHPEDFTPNTTYKCDRELIVKDPQIANRKCYGTCQVDELGFLLNAALDFCKKYQPRSG